MNDKELAGRLLHRHREEEKARKQAERELDERLKGFLFWCSEGCGFVDRNHRCEQWTHITYIPPEAVKAIERRASPEGWISVKERPPDYAVPVLVYCKDYPIIFSATYEESERRRMLWWHVPNYGYSKKVEFEVTHWRKFPPLPSPPAHGPEGTNT